VPIPNLKSLVDEHSEAPVAGDADLGADGHTEEHEASEEGADEMSAESMAQRLSAPHVGYMELEGGWGDGGCGNCKFATPEGFCAHPEIRAYISAEHGCSNEFQPKSEEALIPQDAWEASAKATEASDAE
jgi:hypothetical protein